MFFPETINATQWLCCAIVCTRCMSLNSAEFPLPVRSSVLFIRTCTALVRVYMTHDVMSRHDALLHVAVPSNAPAVCVSARHLLCLVIYMWPCRRLSGNALPRPVTHAQICSIRLMYRLLYCRTDKRRHVDVTHAKTPLIFSFHPRRMLT